MFMAGEEAVTLDLLPLMLAIANEGRLEEGMFLTTFLFEEAKHTDFFNRFINEVSFSTDDLSHYHTENYRSVFYQALPQTLRALLADSSTTAQIRASVTYNMIVEGVLAETGYHAYHQKLKQNNMMPGMQQGITFLKQDESRHIAYGVFLISRLIVADGTLWEVVEATMNALLPNALGVVADAFTCYDPMPFGLLESDFTDYALSQFQKRIERIEKARESTLEEVYRITQHAIDTVDG
jgi:ribonucleoside-diphosphate reductase beta chain